MKRLIEHRFFEIWMNNIFVILGTILGVYLAAQSGFEKAIQFELAKSDRDSYYLRKALHDEFVDNLDMIEGWGREFTGGGARKFIGHPEKYKLNTFVWETMKRSSSTFEIPTRILSEIRKYYIATNRNLSKMTATIPERKAVDAMLVDAREAREKILPLIDKDLRILVEKLENYDIEV